MEIIDIVILLGICFAFCLLILWTYTLGLRNGQKLSKKEEITMPDLNPVNAINKQKEIKENQREQEELLEYLNAIENYDGRM